MANIAGFFKTHKVFSSVLFGLLVIWVIISSLLVYDYVIFSSTKSVKKWGTFVEWVYEPISYLPYRWDHEKNKFYQTLLFPGCEGGLDQRLCDITTEDNKTYTLTLATGLEWSDHQPLTIDDVIFSYQDIVISNLWQQPYLSSYSNIQMDQDEEHPNTLIITFPTADDHNREFFSLPIIPYHIIKDLDLEDYVKKFSVNPVTISCVHLEKSGDDDSLVFNLSTCKWTNINYYQIKAFDNIQEMTNHLNSHKNMVSFYFGSTEQKDYNILPLQDDYFLTLFFNTRSTKLSPRIQRTIAWFINYNFRQSAHTWFISPYTGLLATYQSTWTHLSEFINEKNPSLSYDKQQLEKWGVRSLPWSFTIDWAKRKYAFYLDATDKKEYSFVIETADPVYELKAKTDRSVRYLSTSSDESKKRHTITFTIGEDQQLQEWLNSLTIWWIVLGKKQVIANVDIYYLGKTSSTVTIPKIKIITLANKTNNYLQEQLQSLFIQYHIQDLFEFVSYTTKDQFLQAIASRDYDIVVSPIKLTSLQDVASLVWSEDPQINPSLYVNDYLKTLALNNKRTEFRNIFSSDMPFFIIGHLMKPYRIRHNILFDYTGAYTDDTIKTVILKNVSVVSRNQIKASDLIKLSNIKNFIQKQLQ